MNDKLNKLAIGTIISFILVIAIWLIICLTMEVESIYAKIMSIVSFVPMGCYIVFGTKLLNRLGIDRFYHRL